MRIELIRQVAGSSPSGRAWSLDVGIHDVDTTIALDLLRAGHAVPVRSAAEPCECAAANPAAETACAQTPRKRGSKRCGA